MWEFEFAPGATSCQAVLRSTPSITCYPRRICKRPLCWTGYNPLQLHSVQPLTLDRSRRWSVCNILVLSKYYIVDANSSSLSAWIGRTDKWKLIPYNPLCRSCYYITPSVVYHPKRCTGLGQSSVTRESCPVAWFRLLAAANINGVWSRRNLFTAPQNSPPTEHSSVLPDWLSVISVRCFFFCSRKSAYPLSDRKRISWSSQSAQIVYREQKWNDDDGRFGNDLSFYVVIVSGNDKVWKFLSVF